jgi:hypothetical protein
MDELNATLYPPAVAFELPVAIGFRARLADLTVAELMERPEAWALTLKRFPVLEAVTSTPPINQLLNSGTLYGLNLLQPFAAPEELAALDAELHQHPSFEIAAP